MKFNCSTVLLVLAFSSGPAQAQLFVPDTDLQTRAVRPHVQLVAIQDEQAATLISTSTVQVGERQVLIGRVSDGLSPVVLVRFEGTDARWIVQPEPRPLGRGFFVFTANFNGRNDRVNRFSIALIGLDGRRHENIDPGTALTTLPNSAAAQQLIALTDNRSAMSAYPDSRTDKVIPQSVRHVSPGFIAVPRNSDAPALIARANNRTSKNIPSKNRSRSSHRTVILESRHISLDRVVR